MFLGLSVYAWITIVTILTVFILLLVTKLPADFVFLGGISVLFLSGVLNAKETFAGFCSETVIAVGLLFIVVAGLTHTGVLKWIVRHTLGRPRTHTLAIAKIMSVTAVMSAFLNNTVVVALLVNVVKMWSRKLGITPSKLLIPLSYAAGMGGACTLIGSTPNLLISSMMQEKSGVAFGFFTTTLAGLFCLCVGVLSMIVMRKLLPERAPSENSFENVSDYTVEFLVPTDNPCVGQTLREAGLDKVGKGNLIEIVRFDKEVISPVSPEEFIFGGDRLVFSGDIDELMEVRERFSLVNATEHVFHFDSVERDERMLTAYVPYRSALIGRTMSETGLENSNGFVLAAVARAGEVLRQSPRDLPLEAGDSLLLLAGKHTRLDNLEGRIHFFDSETVVSLSRKTLISSLIMVALVFLTAIGACTLLQACLLATFAMLIFHCCSFEQARKSIDWHILMVFSASIALGTAITKTGIAQAISTGLMGLCGPHPLIVLTVVCFLGTFMTEFVSNTACAAIFFPIAYETAMALNANPMTFCVGLIIAVSSSFATPIGSPTHMLVYGPGGYRFSDFFRTGIPMNLIILTANIFITTLLFPL